MKNLWLRILSFLKKDWEQTVEDLGATALWILGITAWLAVGFILSVCYGFLSKGMPGLEEWSIIISPAIVIALLFLFFASRENKEELPWAGKAFWLFLTWAFLPVIFNGTSIALKWLGAKEAGNTIFEMRFGSLLAVPLLITLAMLVSGLIIDWVQRRRKTKTPVTS